MAEPIVVLDYVNGVAGQHTPPALDPHAPDGVDVTREVRFELGSSAQLPQGPPRYWPYRRLLEHLWRFRRPVFVELDADRVITRLLVPTVGLVVRLEREPDGIFSVGLSTSALRFRLPPSHPRFGPLLALARAARLAGTPVVLTATNDSHTIVDIDPDLRLRAFREDTILDGPVLGEQAIAQASPVERKRSLELFDEIAAAGCALPAGTRGCIPFAYPDDGCWTRAAAMCNVLRGRGIRAVKVWIHGRLIVETCNSPYCELRWFWHVAPAVRIAGDPADLAIVDPALCEWPASVRAWTAALGNGDARISITEEAVWRQATEGVFVKEPEGQLEFELDLYRETLEQRASDVGAPPYDC